MGLLADDVELAFERVLIRAGVAAGDEDLPDRRLVGSDALAELAAVEGHVAPAEQDLPLAGHVLRDRGLAARAPRRVAGQEDHAAA